MTAQMKGNVFDEKGRVAHWIALTRLTNEQHSGRWLGYCLLQG